MDIIIKKEIANQLGFDDFNECAKEDLLKIKELILRDRSLEDADTSELPNLRKFDCSYNPIKKIDLSNNKKLEWIDWSGVRGKLQTIDLSNNLDLKTVFAGQDGLKELDLSNHAKLEILSIYNSSSFRYLDLCGCVNLKRIILCGALAPFYDLTMCHNLEYVDINYMNLYRNKSDEYGAGYPRPIVFVPEDFDEGIIDANTRCYDYYTYLLVKVSPGSKEELILNDIKNIKDVILAIPNDHYGQHIASFHYFLKEKYKL